MGLLGSLLDRLRNKPQETPPEEPEEGLPAGAGAGPYRRAHEPSADEASPPSMLGLPRFDGYEVVAMLDGQGDRYARYQLQPPDPAEPCVAVALFVVDPGADEGWFDIRFDEARLSTRLAHPNLGRVLEMESRGSVWWHLAEYPRGETVERLLDHVRYGADPPGLDLVAAAFADFAAGLHAAHTDTDDEGRLLGWVYRSLDPSSLLLVARGGTGKVVDWGLADLVGTHDSGDSGLADSTGGRVLTGRRSFAYMAPEQIRAAPFDGRADVYALGAILHELAAGTRPFAGENDLAMLERVLNQPAPPLAERVPGCPPEIASLVDRALAKDPAARPFAGELAEGLRAGLAARGVDEPGALVAEYLRSRAAERSG